MDGLGMLGGMLGGMMGGMNPEDVVPAENVSEVVEGNAEEVKPSDDVVNIKTATPYNIQLINHNPEKGQYGKAVLTFLARKDIGSNKDQLVTFSIAYQITKDNEDFIYDLDCVEDDEYDFIGRRILNKSLINYLDSYVVFDTKFATEENFDKEENPYLTLDATESDTRKAVKLRMTTDIASCVMFIDSYIKEMINNDHDFMLATTAGSKISPNAAKFFVVDKIENIVEMAGAIVTDVYEGKNPFKKLHNKLFKKKRIYDTTVGLVLKVSKFVDKDTKETDFILTPFDVGVNFEQAKFRGKTLDDIQGKYFGDADQYVGTLMITNTHLMGVDKDYMIIRGKNKDGQLRLFLFDQSIQEELKHLIDTY